MTTNFSKLAYAKLKIDFDHAEFSKEYDEKIFPNTIPITNGLATIPVTSALNDKWGMVPTEIYNTGDVAVQDGDFTTTTYLKRERPGWQFVQLMQMDISKVTDPLLLKGSKFGGIDFRNETSDSNYSFDIKPQYKDLKIYKWVTENLPFSKINSMHCVSIEPGGFSIIHRDSKGLYNSQSSAGVNKLYKNGYVVINLNISNGGVPLYWSLDGKDAATPFKTDESVYLTNDYFFHGVPVVTSRRRQIRVLGVPTPELWDLMDHNNKIDIGSNYKFFPNYAQWVIDNKS